MVRKAVELSAHPFAIISGNRTQAEQDALYAKGRTKPGPIVTERRDSAHVGGNAFDFAVLDAHGDPDFNPSLYPTVYSAFKAAADFLGIGIMWGGEWKHFKDWDHIQLDPKRDARRA